MTDGISDTRFSLFMTQLLETNMTLGDYVDFYKVTRNVDSISMKLNQLNYLIGQQDMSHAVRELWRENPKAFSVLGILIAVRRRDRKKALTADGSLRLLSDWFDTPDDIIEFLDKTGLTEMLQNRHVKNLVDYVFGVEVGLDTHARKNRSGDSMEDIVAEIFDNNGIDYRREVNSSEFPEISDNLGEDVKRFDFVIERPGMKYLIEVNFYSSSGSKLNETARSYSDIAPKINSVPGYEFVWITDGIGWHSARNKLGEAYRIIPSLYNLTDIKDFIERLKE